MTDTTLPTNLVVRLIRHDSVSAATHENWPSFSSRRSPGRYDGG